MDAAAGWAMGVLRAEEAFPPPWDLASGSFSISRNELFYKACCKLGSRPE